MKIHLIRHAEAIDRSLDCPDAYRSLTSRGRTRFRRVAASLKKQGIKPDIIITSPLIRAVQTADILAEILRFSKDLMISPLLSSGFQLTYLHDLLHSHDEATEIVLVGHEPDFGKLVQELLGVPFPCAMKKGGTVSVVIDLCQTDQPPEFLSLITGSGTVIINKDKALQRLKA